MSSQPRDFIFNTFIDNIIAFTYTKFNTNFKKNVLLEKWILAVFLLVSTLVLDSSKSVAMQYLSPTCMLVLQFILPTRIE